MAFSTFNSDCTTRVICRQARGGRPQDRDEDSTDKMNKQAAVQLIVTSKTSCDKHRFTSCKNRPVALSPSFLFSLSPSLFLSVFLSPGEIPNQRYSSCVSHFIIFRHHTTAYQIETRMPVDSGWLAQIYTKVLAKGLWLTAFSSKERERERARERRERGVRERGEDIYANSHARNTTVDLARRLREVMGMEWLVLWIELRHNQLNGLKYFSKIARENNNLKISYNYNLQ